MAKLPAWMVALRALDRFSARLRNRAARAAAKAAKRAARAAGKKISGWVKGYRRTKNGKTARVKGYARPGAGTGPAPAPRRTPTPKAPAAPRRAPAPKAPAAPAAAAPAAPAAAAPARKRRAPAPSPAKRAGIYGNNSVAAAMQAELDREFAATHPGMQKIDDVWINT